MTIKRKKNKYGRVYLEEYKNIRKEGKVTSIYVRSLGPENPVNSKMPSKTVIERIEHGPSHRAGDVTLLWNLAQNLDMVKIIDRICCEEKDIHGISPGKLLTAWAINRVIDPESATKLEDWIPKTDLPRLIGLEPSDFTKDAFLSALDFVCYRNKWIDGFQDFTPKIDDALYQKWRQLYPLKVGEKETIAYDMTSIMFFGTTCPLSELGYNSNKINRLQANIAMVVNKKDKQPITHFTYNGSRNGKTTIKNLISRMQELTLQPGNIIWDRGNVSSDNIINTEEAGWNIICGLPMISKQVQQILDSNDVKCSFRNLVKTSKEGHIYAAKTEHPLYGKKRKLIVYTNRERGVRDSNARNEALSSVDEALNELNMVGKEWSEKKLHDEISKIVGKYKTYLSVQVKRKDEGSRLSWKFKDREIINSEKRDGKYLLLSTDESLSEKEAVRMYLEKDYIEKVFRTLKTSEEIEPVRHRLEERVKAYIFVCVLAYRLIAYLQYIININMDNEDSWESAYSLLENLERIERVNVKLGRQVKTWFLNLNQKTTKKLEKIGFGELFQEKTEIDLATVGGKKF